MKPSMAWVERVKKAPRLPMHDPPNQFIGQGRACQGYVWEPEVHPDVIDDLPDLDTLPDERDQAHLPTGHRAEPRADLRGQWLQGW